MAKSIKFSVGVGGANRAPDVFTVQYLLNLVPKGQGGPSPELTVDAICGPLTKAAIQKFQRASGAPCDGRVDPGGPTLKKLQAYDPYPMQDLTPAMAGKIGKAGSAAQKAAAEAIMRKIGEAIAKDQAGILEMLKGAGKHAPIPPGLLPGVVKGVSEIIAKATQAAGKVIYDAAKVGGLPVGPNPFGPPPGVKLQDIIAKALSAAQKVTEQAAKQAGGIPGVGPFVNPVQQAGETAAKAAWSIAESAVKAAESVAKWGAPPPPEPPIIKLPISELNAKLTGIIKQATDTIGKLVEETAKLASKI